MFIVIYDDEMGLCVPQSWSEECRGALESGSWKNPVAMFPDRKSARNAIRVSEYWNRVLMHRGDQYDDAYVDAKMRKRFKISPLKELE